MGEIELRLRVRETRLKSRQSGGCPSQTCLQTGSTGGALAAAWCNLPMASAIATDDTPLLVLIDIQPPISVCRASAPASCDAILSMLSLKKVETDEDRYWSTRATILGASSVPPHPAEYKRGTGSCSRVNHDHIQVFARTLCPGLIL